MIRKRLALGLSLVLLATADVSAVVFISEILVNPAGSSDELYEFIELQGTPGRKLDGYALAVLNGYTRKHYPLGSIPPIPVNKQEIDEFFSLDGLQLGPNGLLVLGSSVAFDYPFLLADTHFAGPWLDNPAFWTGGLDVPGKLENDGSNTIVLIRRRPGRTQADPTNPDGLRWGKDILHDIELLSPTEGMVCIGGGTAGEVCRSDGDCLAPGVCGPGSVDQLGDGNVDKADPDNMGGNTLDLKGSSTPEDLSDDLEIVDEVSYEHEQGWEYDFDGRHVDAGSTEPGLPYRHVHALDDPQGINPDALTRVDCRTKGEGWSPAAGGTGELPGGNNWQDTATEQWIRGESVLRVGALGPYFVYDVAANTNPDAIQPYNTQVPLWLNDGVSPDFDFSMGAADYVIKAGQVNLLAVPFMPGDADRDGDVDPGDIAKIAAVFGDDDWVFSNSYADSPETDEGDPALQTRPWDVDATGDNGIEASDLQWTLNFLGDPTGRITGVAYDDTGPAVAGVVLNSAAGVSCTVTASATVPCGRPLSDLRHGEMIEITIRGQVISGVNVTPGQENGIMQFVHDLDVGAPGVVQVVAVQAELPYATTRGDLQIIAPNPLGSDRVSLVNGYTTGFSEGLGTAASLYRVTLRVIGTGDTHVVVSAADEAKFAASTPGGLKIGHTAGQGNPSNVVYSAFVDLDVGAAAPGDLDADGNVDAADYVLFEACVTAPNAGSVDCTCAPADLDGDRDVDLADFAVFQAAYSG
ncbi:MAG: hypothetical protein JXB13_04165 [Phycisphaerae bacterium]|nr:hypothetical protein [Phycisphaerae bacterium]